MRAPAHHHTTPADHLTMASVRTFTLPHYDAYSVHVALFKDVTNAAFLRSQLLEGNQDFDYAFLDAAMVSENQ